MIKKGRHGINMVTGVAIFSLELYLRLSGCSAFFFFSFAPCVCV